MGYYTDFNFENNPDEVIEEINKISGYGDEPETTEYYERKWYSWEEDMRKVSKKFPDVIIHLEGNGEEQGDQWKAYFKNGKAQVVHAEIKFAPFDESKLK